MEYFILELFRITLTLPGALILLLYYRLNGKKKTLKEITEVDYFVSSLIGFILLAGIVAMVRWLLSS